MERAGGLIQEGRFFSGEGVVDNSAARWFRWALERPAGRRVRMDPAVRQVALCPALVDGRFTGMFWSSYAFFDDAQIPAEEERVYALIDAQRAAAYQAPARRHAQLRPLMATAAASATRDDPIEGALNAMLDQASARIGGGAVQGWAVPTNDIPSVTFAADLISAPDASVAVHLIHRWGEGAAWGQAVVYVLKH